MEILDGDEIGRVTHSEQILTPGIKDLTLEIRACRGEVATAFQRLDEWFRRAPEIASDPFSLGDLLRVCAEVVRPEGGEGLNLTLPVEADSEITIVGALFQSLADIFIIILQNVMRHSGLPKKCVEIFARVNEASIEVRVQNPVAFGLRGAGEQKLSKIRSAIDEGKLLEYVGREGGSGFIKIAKILRYELGPKRVLDFGFIHDDLFEVIVNFPIRIQTEPA
ncbi:MAG: hypothetical protein IPN01_29570 [Deltaproteobacteria bacterium]|nr:hypothetical protein [Deltaproteobacteria bacterium]